MVSPLKDPQIAKKLVESLQGDLRSLSAEGKRKYPHVKEASEQIQLKLRTICTKSEDVMSGLVPASAEIIQPFVMGCDTKNPKIVQLCLTAVQRLIAHEAISVTAADNILGMLWNLMEAGLEELKLLQTVIILITTNSVVQHDSLAKDSTTINTAAATIKHLVSCVFERVVTEDKVPIQGTLPVSECGPAILVDRDDGDDADIQTGVIKGCPDIIPANISTAPGVQLPIKREGMPPGHQAVFDEPEVSAGDAPMPSPTLVERPFFPIVMRLLRIVCALIKHY